MATVAPVPDNVRGALRSGRYQRTIDGDNQVGPRAVNAGPVAAKGLASMQRTRYLAHARSAACVGRPVDALPSLPRPGGDG